MGFFGGGQQQLGGGVLPGNIVSVLERYGQYEWNPQANTMGIGELGNLMAGLYPIATADPDRFLSDLATAVLPVGGWAVYGASRLIWELLSSTNDSQVLQNPAYIAIMDATIEFLRSNGVPPMRVRPYEWNYWLGKGGTITSWVPTRRTPSQAEAQITALRPGETRRVAQLTSQSDSNVILVRQKDDGRYAAIIDARQSDEDPRRSQWEWKSADSLYELYAEIGLSQQTPTYWYDRELEPFFPLPPPRI